MLTDIELAQSKKLKPIEEIASLLGLKKSDLYFYGPYKAKIPLTYLTDNQKKKAGKLILVTAMTPTAAGEGKTTTTIGLGMALWRLKKKSIICLREPSLGPCFGIKGGATGGGYAQVLPMEDINLHFTGDIHAVSAAHNLLAAAVDNSIYQGNKLMINPKKVSWRRVVDLNDRALRSIVVGLGSGNGQVRETGFDISVASEVMAILCLSTSLEELKKRLAKIIIGVNFSKQPVYAKDLKAVGAMALLLRDALMPNLVQTYEGTPALIHGGPFANIAHGCNSLMATKMALKLSDYVVTESGFGADLGAEKFFDIKCRVGGLKPSAVVMVVSVRALKHHGHGKIKIGIENLNKHLENIAKFNLPVVVAINRFPDDSINDLKFIEEYCQNRQISVSLCTVWAQGSKGGVNLAEKVLNACEKPNRFKYLYHLDKAPLEIIEIIAKEIYGADGVKYAAEAIADLKRYQEWGIKNLPVCMGKTQSSLSDNPEVLGRPKNFKIKVNEVRISNGAGFYVPICGGIMTMPGLPQVPAAEKVDIDKDGKITGLF